MNFGVKTFTLPHWGHLPDEQVLCAWVRFKDAFEAQQGWPVSSIKWDLIHNEDRVRFSGFPSPTCDKDSVQAGPCLCSAPAATPVARCNLQILPRLIP